MRRFVFFAVVVVALCPGPVRAQGTTGSIVGRVSSQDGAPLAGVTVTVDDPETGPRRTAVTDAAGRYRLVALPPARYELQATLDGFQSYRRNIEVATGRTVTNDITMVLGAVTDVIEVTGEAPLVDVTSTVAGLTVNTDEFNDRIPVGREATQIALLAPTTVSSDAAFDNSTPGQNVVSIGGASAGENLYTVNGLDITNFRNMVGSSFVPFEFLQEVQVKTGGYEAEFGRSTGGVINMVTKSGTNTLRGDFNVFYAPEKLQEQNDDAWDRQNRDEFSESLEANASLGGPILPDTLFFFGFIRYDDTEYSDIFGERETASRNDAPYYGAKLDWNITSNHRLEGTYLVDQTDFENTRYVWNTDDRVREDELGTATNKRGGTNWIARYTGILTESFLVSGQYGVNDFDRSDTPATSPTGDTCYYAYDSRVSPTPIGCWVNWQTATGGDERTAYRLDVDWYLGNHSIRGGYDNEDLESTENAAYAGGVRYQYFSNHEYPEIPEGADIVQIRDRTTGGTFDATTSGVYAQDSWAVSPGFTLNFGVRWERYENFNTAGDAFITIDDQYAPRVGAIWDHSGNGRSKLYGSFGQYHIPIATNTNIRLAGLEYDILEFYEVVDQDLANGMPYFPNGEPTGLGQLLEIREVSSGIPPDVETVVASSFDPMSQIEYILGYEQMVGQDWSFGIRGVHRTFVEVIEDFTIDQALYEKYGLCGGGCFQYVLGNPGSSFRGYYDLDDDGVNDAISFAAEELGYPEAQRDYWAVELTANKRFSNNWLLQASYVWSQCYGNYEGYLKSDIGQADAGLSQDFDFPGLMDNASGFLPNDRRHNLKVYGAYAWDSGLQVGGFLNWRTGRPINAFGVHPNDFWAGLYENSSFFEQVTPGPDGLIPSPRGSQGTTDDVLVLDALVRYDFQIGGIDWTVRLDVFNPFNQQSTVEVREESGTPTLGVDPGFLQTTAYQSARSVAFGFGLSF